MRLLRHLTFQLVVLVLSVVAPWPALAAERLAVLFLGDQGHHRPATIQAAVAEHLRPLGIDLTYTDDVGQLAADNLSRYDCLLIYRDSGDLPVENEAALVSYIEKGKGLVAVHCASHCFRNSAKYTALIGGRFAHHESGEFRATIIDAQHPAMRGAKSFTSWDETYVHNELSDDRRVLMVRQNAGGYEPYAWVREQEAGRVYYTALGHDERTWRMPEFQTQLATALRWAAGRVQDDQSAPEFTSAGEGLPNYIAGKKWGTEGERLERMPKPLAPAASQQHWHMPEGFRIELYASEPNIGKAIAMSFDGRGRLWLAESTDYPNTLLDNPHENGADRIRICEDSDGDGCADKFSVFADRLNIPTSVLPVRGGAIVAVAPHLLYLEDTDGDDRADRRTILFTGFGRRDTHAVTSNLHYGLDNWVYAAIGYSGGEIKLRETEHSFKQGLYRFRPNGSEFEFLTSTSNNTWGLGISEAGDIFASTANNDHSVFLGLPNRYFESVRGWHGAGSSGIADHTEYHPIAEDVRQMDWHGKFTAASGHELYTARHFPREYWNRAALVCEPTGHLVHLDWLVPQGSSFTAREGFNLLASTDPWSAPIAAQVGPDGAVWVLDWYNYVIQHNPTPHGFKTGPGNAYETTLRDRSHGRVYRLIYGEGAPPPAPRLSRDNPAELLVALANDNMSVRLQAQRLLVERAQPDVVPELLKLAADEKQPAGALHALWTLAGLRDVGAVARHPDPFVAVAASRLKSEFPALRRAGLQLLPRTAESIKTIVNAGSLVDADPQVRLTALQALSEMPASAEGAKAVAAFLARPETERDRWLPLAATAAAARNGVEFLSEVLQLEGRPPSPAPLVTAVRVVTEHVARGETRSSLLPQVEKLSRCEPALASAVVAGLNAGWPADAPPAADEKLQAELAGLLRRLPGSQGLPVITLAGRWQAAEGLHTVAQEMQGELLKEALDNDRPDQARRAALDGALALGVSPDMLDEIVALVTPRVAPQFAEAVLNALGESNSPEIAAAMIRGWSTFPPSSQAKAAAVLLRRPDWTRAFLTALDREEIPLAGLSVEIEQRLAQHPDKELSQQAQAILARGGRLATGDRQKVYEQLRSLATETGDAAAGKVVFEKNCAKCHRHSGKGGNVGPDLTGMAARKRADILLDILDPNRSVEGNFQQYNVVTADGRVLSGLLASESRTTIELLDAEARRQVILRDDIDQIIGSKLSLMPEGFEKLPPEELVDLLAFLAARGRYFSLPLEKAATTVSTVGMFQDRNAEVERLIFPDWNPRTLCGVPFNLVDPQGERARNVIMLYGPQGVFPPQMPRSVSIPCNAPAKAIHLLSGVSGWGYPLGQKGSLTMTVRLVYADGQTEDHPLRNGEHFADYIRQVDVPGSKFAARLREQQIRYLEIEPARRLEIEHIEFIKGDDATAPVVMAATVELPE